MTKRYFKYIITTFIMLFVFNLNVNAANAITCYYEYSPNENTKLRISYIIDQNGGTDYGFTVKDLVNNKIYSEKFGSPAMIEDSGVVAYVHFKDEAVNLINENKTCVNLGSLLDSNGNLLITGTEKNSTDDQTYKLLKPTSYSSTTPEDSDPIVDSFEKSTNGVTMTFGKRRSGKYYFKIQSSTDSNETTFSGAQTISLSLNYRGNNHTYKINSDEIEDIWEKGKTSTIRIFNPGENVRIISLKQDLNGYNEARDDGNNSNNNTVTITGREDGNSNGNIQYLSDICNNDTNALKAMRVIGFLSLIIKILIPIGLIANGAINFANVIISGDQENLKKKAKNFAWNIIAAIAVFVLPTIINFVVGLVVETTNEAQAYENCRVCIFEPSKCKIPN